MAYLSILISNCAYIEMKLYVVNNEINVDIFKYIEKSYQ